MPDSCDHDEYYKIADKRIESLEKEIKKLNRVLAIFEVAGLVTKGDIDEAKKIADTI